MIWGVWGYSQEVEKEKDASTEEEKTEKTGKI